MDIPGMLAGARQSTAEGGFGCAKHPGCAAETEAFGDGMECLGDALGRRFESIEWSVSSGGDLSFAGLAEKIPDRLVATMVAVGNQGMHGRIRDPEVLAIGVRTGVTLSVGGFLAAARAFALAIRSYGSWGSE